MYLKEYQKSSVDRLRTYLILAKEEKKRAIQAKETLQIDHNWPEVTDTALGIAHYDSPKNGISDYYPRVVMKIPTGGGKTVLAVEAIREYQERFREKRTGLVVWIVPTETIYSQTVTMLRDRTHPLRQLLDQSSGGKTLILEKGQKLNQNDLEQNLVVLFIMIQSVSRLNAKESLKVFQDSGGYEGFFPADHRTDLHAQLIQKTPNLDLLSEIHGVGGLIRTSLGNAIRVSQPLIIIDEIHKVFSEQAQNTINNLNPEFVLGLSATPTDRMNLLIQITGLQLKDEEMVKLDLHIIPPHTERENDWKDMIRNIQNHRDSLEKKAKKLKGSTGQYIRPIALIQVESTGKDQRGRGNVHSLDAKDFLVELGVNPDEIAIKTSTQNDIEDINLFSSNCEIRYIITKQALQEGWDCSFAYILGVIPNVNSNTAITQIIGRILRQPLAKKTGISELDESYVYYTKGNTREILDKVVTGFEKEGLGDLAGKVQIAGGATTTRKKLVKIRDDFKKHAYAFYLPVWLMVDSKKKKRRFSYSVDILPRINLEKFSIQKDWIARVQSSISEITREVNTYRVTIDPTRQIREEIEGTIAIGADHISLEYATRRYHELIPNAFLARKLARDHLTLLEQEFTKSVLHENFGYIVSELYKSLEIERIQQEEEIFLELTKAGELVLAVSSDSQLGWQVPEKDEIVATDRVNPYNYYLFTDVEIHGMNELELQVGDTLERQEKILWWFRNKSGRNWYSIQGWKKGKIYPDFVAAKKDGDRIDVVYVLESKGSHLIGNSDTIYKEKVLNLITETKKQGKIKKHQEQSLPFPDLNNSVEAYLFPDTNRESKIRELFQ